jgi:hypothetical protein
VEGKRNSRGKKKTTPSIQNYKTPKQQNNKKEAFKRTFKLNESFDQWERGKRERLIFLY